MFSGLMSVRYADAVGRGERAGDLNRDLDRVIQFQALFQPLAQRHPSTNSIAIKA